MYFEYNCGNPNPGVLLSALSPFIPLTEHQTRIRKTRGNSRKWRGKGVCVVFVWMQQKRIALHRRRIAALNVATGANGKNILLFFCINLDRMYIYIFLKDIVCLISKQEKLWCYLIICYFIWPVVQTLLFLSCKSIELFSLFLNCSAVNFPFLWWKITFAISK